MKIHQDLSPNQSINKGLNKMKSNVSNPLSKSFDVSVTGNTGKYIDKFRDSNSNKLRHIFND
jgi:hypothetical protein